MPDRETWEYINTFAPWLSAVGTLLAVVVSLYFSRRTSQVKISLSAGYRIEIGPGYKEPYPQYIFIKAVNTGARDVKITGFGWRIGIFKKRYFYQVVDGIKMRSDMPIMLSFSEEASYLIDLNIGDNWIKRFVKDEILPNRRLNMVSLRVYASTSIGKTVYSKIENSLKKELNEECDRQLNK